MRQQQLFRKGPGPALRALVFLFLSVVLLILHQHVAPFQAAEARISASIQYPFQWVVDTPFRLWQALRTGLVTRHQLERENEALRIHQTLLQWQLQQLLAIEKENIELRKLLQSSSELSPNIAVARVFSIALNPNEQRLVLDIAKLNNIYLGQPVFDAYGLMGQVIALSPPTCRVLLITDEQSAVPVENARTGLRAIAVGLGGSGELQLVHVPSVNADLRVGDYFVTSGMDQRYPAGFPVGRVTQIKSRIILTPAAQLNVSNQVLLVWPSASNNQEKHAKR